MYNFDIIRVNKIQDETDSAKWKVRSAAVQTRLITSVPRV